MILNIIYKTEYIELDNKVEYTKTHILFAPNSDIENNIVTLPLT